MNKLHNIKILIDAYIDSQEDIINMIRSQFSRHIDRQKAEDIFSYAFLDTCEKIRKGKFDLEASGHSLKAYLYKVCYWQACKATRRNPKVTYLSDAPQSLIDDGQLSRLAGLVNAHEGGDDLVNACDEAECQHALSMAIGNMSETCRKILMQHYWDGFSYELIAQQLSKKATAVKMQAKRCKDSFINHNKHILQLCKR